MPAVLTCLSCRLDAPAGSRFCPRCGAPIVADGETRLAYNATPVPSSASLGTVTPTTDIDHGRFLPGVTLGGRYRIIGRIGRGGMGEVYRADDLRLSQPVALKFLPDDLSRDAARLAQFHAEVRLARQVSHPNVCRVYDVGEDAGTTFLSMEYIDGEDLASLLRRIGRLPQDKALDLARELCAGLAASHERGVIHRDLKPANLMIDGQGHLRITDFGIAAISSTGGAIAGTPGYLAPELLTGGSATVASDIYALGLVLYELFTGRKAFSGDSLADIVRAQQERMPTNPTTWVRDLDPVVEATILRCLAREPAERPASALTVAAMLPGGDPLAAALARGETPSPEMVAAAGETEAIAPWKGVALVGSVVAAMIATLLLADRSYLVNFLNLEKPPAVLADRAEEIIASAGYPARVGEADGFGMSPDYLRWISRNDSSAHRWAQLRGSRGASVVYWYRVSPRMLTPWGVDLRPALHNPPMNITGQAGVILDPRGRLLEFHAVPPQFDDQPAVSAETHWKVLFDAAHLDMTRFTPAAPNWTPRQYADTRAAWTGTVPENPGVTLRIEAASYRGKPVFFTIAGPWTEPSRMREQPQTWKQRAVATLGRALLVALLLGAVLLAWRNTRAGRGDRHGATFAASLVFALSFAGRVLMMYHVPDAAIESERFFVACVAIALFDAAMLWVLYMAVEPAVRRFWPDSLLGWSRLVSGRVRDPRVGRDLLYGIVAGIAIVAMNLWHDMLPPLFGAPQPIPSGFDTSVWAGMHVAAGRMLLVGRNALQNAGLALFALVLLRMIFRSRVAASIGVLLFFIMLESGQFANTQTLALDLTFAALTTAAMVLVIARLGLLSSIVMFFVYLLCANLPLTSAFGAWYGHVTAFALALVLSLAVAGFWMARGNAALFGRPLLDDTDGSRARTL